MGGWYIVFTAPLSRGEQDHIGPFDDRGDAEDHRRRFGPARWSDIRWTDDRPEPCMDPEEHIEDVMRRSDTFDG